MKRLALALVMAAGATNVLAAPVTLHFAGSYSGYAKGIYAPLLGTAFTGSFTFDDEPVLLGSWQDSNTYPNSPPIYGAAFTYTAPQQVEVHDATGTFLTGVVRVDVTKQSNSFGMSFSAPNNTASIGLSFNTASFPWDYTTDSLQKPYSLLTGYSGSFYRSLAGNSLNAVYGEFQITSVEQVPLPGSVIFLGSALSLLAGLNRKSRARAARSA